MVKRSRFSRFHPITLLVYFASILFGCMFLVNPVILILAVAGAIGYIFLLSYNKFLKTLPFYLLLLLVVTVTNPLFSHNGETILFFLNGNPVTVEALMYGAQLGVMIIAALAWFSAFSQCFDGEKVMFIAGKSHPNIATMISMCLHYVPYLKLKFNECEQAQLAIGAISYNSLFEKVSAKFNVLLSVTASSAESAIVLSRSMNARGFANKRKSTFIRYRFNVSDLVLTIISIIMLIIVAIAIISGELAVNFYPSIEKIPSSALALLFYILYGFSAFLPLFIEITEQIRWKIYVLKI